MCTKRCRGKRRCTSIWSQERDGRLIHQNEARLLQVAVTSRPDHQLRGHQGGLGPSGRQRLPQDQDRQAPIRGPRASNEGADAADAVAAQRSSRRDQRLARRAAAEAGRSLQLLHLPPAVLGRRGHGVLRGRLLRLMPITLVCLNLNRRDTWQQPDPAYRPASRANKKAGLKGYISVRTLFNNVCTLYEMYVAICTKNISFTYLDIHVCKQEIGNRHVCTCM